MITAKVKSGNQSPQMPETTHSEKRGPRILFVGESVSLAHVGRPLKLARWAREAGYEVAFACGKEAEALVRAENFSPEIIPTVSGEVFRKRLGTGTFFYSIADLEEYVTAEDKLLRRVNPDLVVSDFRLTLAISCKRLGVPLLSLSNAYWSPGHPCPFEWPVGWVLDYLPQRLRRRYFSAVRPMAFRLFAKPLNRTRIKYGLKPVHDFREMYTAGNWCAYLDHPKFVEVPRLPHGHFFLGALAWTPEIKSQAEGALPVGGPLVYVSLGGGGATIWLSGMLRVLSDLGCCVVLSGLPVDVANHMAFEAGVPKDRFYARRLMDPQEALQTARLTVCHGGSGTVYQSLEAGVPVLGLPSNPDQLLVSQAVQQAGAGMGFSIGVVSEAKMKDAVGEILSNGQFERNAQRISKMLKTHDSRQCWLKFLRVNLKLSMCQEAN